MSKKLANWKKSEEAQGHSERQLRDQLIKQGHLAKELEGTIDSIGEKGVLNKVSAKEIFKPTVLKLFFPILIFILIIISFLVNSAYMPSLGEHMCNLMTSNKEGSNFVISTKEKGLENNANPLEIIGLFKQMKDYVIKIHSSLESVYTYYEPLADGNAYFIFSKIYKLNPFFPIPCEVPIINEYPSLDSKFCRYYISQENYNCLNIDSNLPPYNKISLIYLIFHGFILISLIYFIICLIAYCNKKLSQKENKIKFIVSAILFLILILLYKICAFYRNENVYSLCLPLILYVIVFIVYSFIRNNSTRKILSYIIAVLIILLLIGGIFVINHEIKKEITEREKNWFINFDYELYQCNNTKILSLEEKQSYINSIHINDSIKSKYADEEWKICYDPSCSIICKNNCNIEKYNCLDSEINKISLRGDTPSCICGWRIN